MVDHIKKSVAELEAPSCEKCFVPMKWFSAQLLPRMDNIIEHTFYCTSCSRTAKIKTTLERTEDGSDPKLRMAPSNIVPFYRRHPDRAA